MRNFLYVFTAVLIFGLISNLSVISAQEVTFHSLLNEMVDLQAVLKPTPEFTCGQFSSFDRKAKSPAENWFANADHSQFLREETRNGQKEYVLMESKGPGGGSPPLPMKRPFLSMWTERKNQLSQVKRMI